VIERDFLFSPYGHGWHLDRALFEAQLSARAVNLGADYRYGSRIVGLSRSCGTWTLETAGPEGMFRVECDFLVDASGRAGRFSRRLGANTLRYDSQIAVWARLRPDNSGTTNDAFTLVESVKTGWWYSSRLPDGALMVIYFTDRDLADIPLLTSYSGWIRSLGETEHTRRRIRKSGQMKEEYLARFSKPRILPANNARLDVIGGPGWLATGDAATAYDPLSSYGITASLAAGVRAGEAVAEVLSGRAGAIDEYAGKIARVYDQYLTLHRDHYLAEQRWPNEPYWRRRHRPDRLKA
jgi:flavin-dependent dehydrogenase